MAELPMCGVNFISRKGLVRTVALSFLSAMAAFGILGCRFHRGVHDITESEMAGLYRVEKPTWSSVLRVNSDHSFVQELIEDGKTVKRTQGKWQIRRSPGWVDGDQLFLDSCIDLHDNPRDLPGVDSSMSNFGKQVGDSYPIERDIHARTFLVIDEQENDLEFIKQ